jgi:hypothetical protein
MTRNLGVILAALVFLATLLLLPHIASAQGSGNGTDQQDSVSDRVEERKAAARQRIEDKRAQVEEKTQAARQAACERREDTLEASMERVSTQAGRLLGVIDKIYDRVQGFYETGQLTVSNYDELNAAVTDAQQAAKVEIEALDELNVEIDCENPDVAGSVAAFRDSATAARQSLKDYRAALVALISSLRAEAAENKADDSSSDDATDDSSENENENENETENENESGDDNSTGDQSTDNEGSQ